MPPADLPNATVARCRVPLSACHRRLAAHHLNRRPDRCPARPPTRRTRPSSPPRVPACRRRPACRPAGLSLSRPSPPPRPPPPWERVYGYYVTNRLTVCGFTETMLRRCHTDGTSSWLLFGFLASLWRSVPENSGAKFEPI
jgi:hypothetical protein